MSQLNAAQLAAFSVDIYDAADDFLRRLPPGFTRLSEMSKDGLHAVAYLNRATGELVIAYQGATELRSVFTSLSSVTATGGTVFNAALDFVTQARAQAEAATGLVLSDGDVTLTGHGVGGGFASLLSVATGLQATTFNGLRIGGLLSALEDRFGALAQDYASRIVNYVDTAEDLYTLPRRTTQVGKVVDVQTSSLSFFGQLQSALGTDGLGGNALESVYDWLATENDDRQRAQRLLMALEHEFGGVELVDGAGQAIADGSATDMAQTEVLVAQLNKLMQTDRADLIQSRAFDRMLVDGSDFGERQDASGYGESDDLLVGATGADTLVGGAGKDVLFGGNGNDILAGGAGEDYLLGGDGSDVYQVAAGGANDTLRDKQGTNRIVVDGTPLAPFFIADGRGGWKSVDGSASLTRRREHVDRLRERFFGDARGVRRRRLRGRSPGGEAGPGDDPIARRRRRRQLLRGHDRERADRREGGDGRDLRLRRKRLRGWGGRRRSDLRRRGRRIRRRPADRRQRLGHSHRRRRQRSALWARLVDLEQAIADKAATPDPAKGDWLAGGEGEDLLVGSASADVLTGGGGRDVLVGGAGDDFLMGDADYRPVNRNWTFSVRPDGRPTDFATASPEATDPGSSAADVIYGGAGDDWVWGGLGDDFIYGEAGKDQLFGNLGADTVVGGEGGDVLAAGGRKQVDLTDGGDDYLDGGAGNDTLYGSAGNTFLFGGDGDDVIMAGPGADLIDGGAGNDRISAQGADVAYGGDGDDQISAFGTAAVVLHGGDGADFLRGDQGRDALFGDAGDDVLMGDEGDDLLDGGAGNDRYLVAPGSGTDEIHDDGGYDVVEIQSIEAASPELAVSRDSIRLLADNSELYLAYGSLGDKIRLGPDPRGLIERIEVKRYAGATVTVETIDFAGMRVEYIGGQDSEILFGAEGFMNRIVGGGGRDILIGGGLADELVGGAGNDVMRGGDGGDTVLDRGRRRNRHRRGRRGGRRGRAGAWRDRKRGAALARRECALPGPRRRGWRSGQRLQPARRLRLRGDRAGDVYRRRTDVRTAHRSRLRPGGWRRCGRDLGHQRGRPVRRARRKRSSARWQGERRLHVRQGQRSGPDRGPGLHARELRPRRHDGRHHRGGRLGPGVGGPPHAEAARHRRPPGHPVDSRRRRDGRRGGVRRRHALGRGHAEADVPALEHPAGPQAPDQRPAGPRGRAIRFPGTRWHVRGCERGRCADLFGGALPTAPGSRDGSSSTPRRGRSRARRSTRTSAR